MSDVYEITIWARGVVQDMEGRHMTLIMASSADKDGKFVQAWDDYADLPDRVGVPLRKYVRISDEEIEMRYEYENKNPSLVVLMDDTIVKGLNILWGMDKGGVLVVNSKRSPDEILKFIPNKDLLSKIICVDAEEEFSMEGLDFMGSEGGVEVSAVGAGISAVLAGAACHGTENLTIDSLVAVSANKAGAKAGYETAVVKDL